MSSACKYCGDWYRRDNGSREYYKDMCGGCVICVGHIVRRFYTKEEEINKDWEYSDFLLADREELLKRHIAEHKEDVDYWVNEMTFHLSHERMSEHIASLTKGKDVIQRHEYYLDYIFKILGYQNEEISKMAMKEEKVRSVYTRISNEKTERESYVFKKYEDLIMAEFLQNRLVKTIKKTKRKQNETM